jgi:hypothetical protein
MMNVNGGCTLGLRFFSLPNVTCQKWSSRQDCDATHQEVREDTMLCSRLLEASLAAAVVTFSAGYSYADEFLSRAGEFSARLSGFNELGALNNQTGAILSDGSGTVSLTLIERRAR